MRRSIDSIEKFIWFWKIDWKLILENIRLLDLLFSCCTIYLPSSQLYYYHHSHHDDHHYHIHHHWYSSNSTFLSSLPSPSFAASSPNVKTQFLQYDNRFIAYTCLKLSIQVYNVSCLVLIGFDCSHSRLKSGMISVTHADAQYLVNNIGNLN